MKRLIGAIAGFGQFALAAWMAFPLETLFGGWFKNPGITATASSNTQFAGLTTLVSGSATVTVSTTNCRSDDIIFITPQHMTAQNSGFGVGVSVRSINPGNAIVMGWSDGLGRGFTTTLMWWTIRGN